MSSQLQFDPGFNLGLNSGFELELAFAFLPTQSKVTSQFPHIFRHLHPVGESGPAGHSLTSLVCATAALRQADLQAAIYESAFDEATAHIEADHTEVLALRKNLQTAGYLIPSYQKDMFCLGLDPTTSILSKSNQAYYSNSPESNIYEHNTVCGIEINGPVRESPAMLADSFRTMIDALKDIGITVPITCGIHQHISVETWSAQQLTNFAIIDSFFDSTLRTYFFPKHREKSLFCMNLDHYLIPPQNTSSLVFLSDSLNNYCNFLNTDYGHSKKMDLLIMMSHFIQSNMYPSRENNHAFRQFVDSHKKGTIEEDFEDLILLLRGQRYFQTNFESVTFTDRHTIEKRWMPATLDAELTETYFFINYLMVKNSGLFSSAKITYNDTRNCHVLLLKEHGRTEVFFDNSLDDLIKYMSHDHGSLHHASIPQESHSKETSFPARNHSLRGISQRSLNTAIETANSPEAWQQKDADDFYQQSPTPFHVTDAEYQARMLAIETIYNLAESVMTGAILS